MLKIEPKDKSAGGLNRVTPLGGNEKIQQKPKSRVVTLLRQGLSASWKLIKEPYLESFHD